MFCHSWHPVTVQQYLVWVSRVGISQPTGGITAILWESVEKC